MIARTNDPDDEDLEGVPFVPFRCPHCGRHKPRTYKVRGKVRYHRCQACGRHYKSYEVPPDFVRDWRPD